MLGMGFMMAGAGTVDTITATMLPITAKHFTGHLGLIAFMVALNRICGFLVQPYAAFKSDRHLSAGGRRRPYLLVAWPATLVSVALLGLLPVIVPAEYHRTTMVVGVLFLVNLGMQAFLDMCYGSGDPMYGDTFVSGNLGRANAVRMIINSTISIAMTYFFVSLADRNEMYPYLGAMLFVAISWGVTAFFIKETIPTRLPAAERYNLLKPLAELRTPQTRNVAIVGSAVLVALALTEMFHALFVTETLGFTKAEMGQSIAASIVLSLLCPYPLGQLVDRIGARKVLIVGFLLVIAVELAFVFWVNDRMSLYVCLILFKVSWFIVHIPIVPLMYHNTPEERRGSIFAAVQMTRAGVTSLATIAAGFLAHWVSSYRMCYLVAAVVCLIGLYGAMQLTPTPPTPRASEPLPA
jgi:MFS family permease